MAPPVEYRWSPSYRLYRTTRHVFGPIVRAYFRASWSGTEHIPATGALVLACNHLSNLDPVLLGAACPRQINYLAKIELFGVPVLGRLIQQYGAIPLRRSASDPDAMRLVERVLECDQVVALFPEGTRSRDGKLKPFRFGAARLALKRNAELVPVAIVGTERAMPAGASLPKRTTVKIAFGPPLNLKPYRYTLHGHTPEAEMLQSVTSMLEAEVGRLKDDLDRQLGS